MEYIAIFVEQRPLLKFLNDSQVRRLVEALFTTFFDGEVVDFSDDPQLEAFWPSFYGPQKRAKKNIEKNDKISDKQTGNQNARKKTVEEEPIISVDPENV